MSIIFIIEQSIQFLSRSNVSQQSELLFVSTFPKYFAHFYSCYKLLQF